MQTEPDLDRIDRKILSILQKDGRIANLTHDIVSINGADESALLSQYTGAHKIQHLLKRIRT